MVDQRTVRDPSISFKAKGLLLWLLDRPDDWVTTVDRLAEVGPDGAFAISAACRELEASGYLTRTKERSETGVWEAVWVIRERPLDAETAAPPHAETADGPHAETADGSQVAPHAETASLKKTENYKTKTERTKRERSLSLAVSALSPALEAFDGFWEVYPRRTGKGAARTAFVKATTRASTSTIIAGALAFRDDPNRDPQFTPHPATWLSQDRWEDDPLPSRTNAKAPSIGARLARGVADGTITNEALRRTLGRN